MNVKAPPERVPPELRPLLALMEDTLDGQVDEQQYPDDISRRILEQIRRTQLSPEENAQLKDEATWEHVQRDAFRSGIDEGKKLGIDEGKKLGMQYAIIDLCEAYGIDLTNEQRNRLYSLDVHGLDAFRASLKAHRQWPTTLRCRFPFWLKARRQLRAAARRSGQRLLALRKSLSAPHEMCTNNANKKPLRALQAETPATTPRRRKGQVPKETGAENG